MLNKALLGRTLFALATLSCMTYAKNGVFVGVEYGNSILFSNSVVPTHLNPPRNTESLTIKTPALMNIGISVGMQYEINDRFYIRGYLHYLYGLGIDSISYSVINGMNTQDSVLDKKTTDIHNAISAGINAYYSFYNGDISIYVLGGLELGFNVALSYNTTSSASQSFSKTDFIMPINIGIGLGFEDSHHLEFKISIPTFSTTYAQSENVTIRNLGFLVGYYYLF